MSTMGFMPGPLIPLRCSCCPKQATWLVYNKTINQEVYHCDDHVPPVGTPRIKRLENQPNGFMTHEPPPPGILY